jgi:hypothetical protein
VSENSPSNVTASENPLRHFSSTAAVASAAISVARFASSASQLGLETNPDGRLAGNR